MKRLIVFICLFSILGCGRSEELEYSNLFPSHPPGNGVAGAYGEPPRSIRKLIPPINNIDAGGFLDGGTTYVRIRDSTETEVVFCVTQEAFPSDTPAYSLMIGGRHDQETSSRYPVSTAEVRMIKDSLADALKHVGDASYETLKDSDSQRARQLLFANQADRMLKQRTEYELASISELNRKIEKMRSVDIDSAGLEFRQSPPLDRLAIWEKMKPRIGFLLREGVENQKLFLVELFGEPEVIAVRQCSDFFKLQPGDEKRVLAYRLGHADGMYVYLRFDLRGESVKFGEFRTTRVPD